MRLRTGIIVSTVGLALLAARDLAGRQAHALHGVIGSQTDGAVVAGALVSVGDMLSVQTGVDGAFAFTDVPRGSHRLIVTAVGFAAAEFTFTIDDTMPAVIDLGLVALRPLPSLAVRLTGAVVDSGSALPVANAQVFVAGDSAAVTDSTGAFFLEAFLPPGPHVVLVRAIGYRLVGYELMVSHSGPVAVDVRLPRSPVALAEIEVVERAGLRGLTGFLQRMESEIGQFLTPADVEQLRRGVLTTSEMLARVPGIMVRPTRYGRVVALARCGRPELFLDGKPVEAEEIDDIIPLEHVAAVEVYSDPGRIPPQFNRMQPRRGRNNYGACGAILFWTLLGGRNDG